MLIVTVFSRGDFLLHDAPLGAPARRWRSVAAAAKCTPRKTSASRSTTRPESMRRWKNCAKSWSSSKRRKSTKCSAAEFPRACCWWDRPAPEKRCWPRPSPAKLACRSSACRAPTSWRCSSASAPPGSAICSSRPRPRPPASSSSTSWMRWARPAARVLSAATTSENKRSMPCWSKWTASVPTAA